MNPHVTTEEEVAWLYDFYCCLETCDPHHVTKQGNELTKPQSLLHMCVISAAVKAIKTFIRWQPCSEVRPVALC